MGAYIGNATHRGLSPEDLDALVDRWTGPEGQPAFTGRSPTTTSSS